MKDDSAPPSGGVGSSRWKELIEVASPISGPTHFLVLLPIREKKLAAFIRSKRPENNPFLSLFPHFFQSLI